MLGDKLPLVVWSGGMDSTAILINLFSKRIPFETCYITLENNKDQQERELKARRKVLKKLKKLYGNYHIKDNIINVFGTLNVPGGSKLIQPYIWLNSIMVGADLSRYNEIQFGYIKPDDFWHIKPAFEAAYKALAEIVREESTLPKLGYPVEWYTKQSLYDQYYKFDDKVVKLFKHITVCEATSASDGKPCGICKKCKELGAIEE